MRGYRFLISASYPYPFYRLRVQKNSPDIFNCSFNTGCQNLIPPPPLAFSTDVDVAYFLMFATAHSQLIKSLFHVQGAVDNIKRSRQRRCGRRRTRRYPLMLRNSYSNFSRTDYIQFARSPLVVVVVHCMQQANAFDCMMFAAAFAFECIPVTLPAAK